MLINRDFRLLWLGQSVSMIGTRLFDTTLMLWVATGLLAGRSQAPLASAAVPVIATAVTLLVGPAAGVFVDRWDKRRTMIWAESGRAVLIGLFAVALTVGRGTLGTAGSLALIGVAVALNSAGAQFLGPARSALIGDVVPEGDRGKAAGYRQATTAMSVVLGPTIAAPLLIGVGPAWAIAGNALSFAVSAWCIARTRPPVRPAAPGHGRPGISGGLRAFARTPVLRAMLVSLAIALLGAETIAVIDVYFLTENLHAAPQWFGLLSASMGVGVLSGSLLCGRFGARIGHRRVFCGGVVLFGLLMMLYAKQTSLAPGVVIIALYGAAIGAVNTANLPLILGATAREVRGRVFSLFSVTNECAALISMATAGWLAATLPAGLHFEILTVGFGRLDSVFFAAGLLILLAGCHAYRAMRAPRAGVADRHEPAVELPTRQ